MYTATLTNDRVRLMAFPLRGMFMKMKWVFFVALLLAALLLGPAAAADADAGGADGFLGLAWGTKPQQVAGLTPVPWQLPFDAYRTAKLDGGQVYFGDAATYTLVFSPDAGLVQGRVEIDSDRWPSEGRMAFISFLGMQLMIEPAPGVKVLPTWHVGDNTRVVEIARGAKTVYIFSRRDFAGLPAR